MNQCQEKIVKHILFSVTTQLPSGLFSSGTSPSSCRGPGTLPSSQQLCQRANTRSGSTHDAPPFPFPRKRLQSSLRLSGSSAFIWILKIMVLMAIIFITKAYIKSQDVGFCHLGWHAEPTPGEQERPGWITSSLLWSPKPPLSFHFQERPSPWHWPCLHLLASCSSLWWCPFPSGKWAGCSGTPVVPWWCSPTPW